ncbi:probable ATP-dependent RNA helicase DDX5 [Rhipicephalus sanguineus]|uniref:RNA helicase n=1 Tax=Rhipicephalus sanguineus TaxID=34632 RepID=A0A9D4PTK7_RHISA|nr:probable ATP-dependent RNA helicase DDX5 [Rhipicephalus sanguineus]KAH7951485.1 hypothetical protein HPB52_009802 [Rhipicephalus sanguineus]
MANQLVGVNPGVQLGPPNGLNELLPPNPPLNADPFGGLFGDVPVHWKNWFLSMGDRYSVQRYFGPLRSPSSVVNIRRPGPPNWGGTHLQPFERNFYREHFRTAWRYPEAVKEYREKNGITILNGRGVPKPLLHIYEANFPACLVEALEANSSTSSPTPAQAQCWPVALKGKDLLAVLGTGDEGKTLAYILPAIVHVLAQPRQEHHQGFLALVLAPTPEEAREIQRVVGKLETYTGVRTTCVCSGDPKDRQLRDLRRGFDICVATPGRLHTFLKEDELDIGRCTYLVLDGADRMVDMGFEQQLISIARYVRPDRQTMMWASRRPRHLYRLVDALLKDCVEIHIGMCQASPDQSVQHVVRVCADSEKEAGLAALLEDILGGQEEAAARKVIVFAETKKRVDDLVSNLRLRDRPVVGVHGRTSDSVRDWALSAFRRGKTPILVATDAATRRLPSDGVRFVVNYDYPSSAEAYSRRLTHASHSTGRDSGVVYTFIEPDDSLSARQMIGILRAAKSKVHPELYAIAKATRWTKRGVSDV